MNSTTFVEIIVWVFVIALIILVVALARRGSRSSAEIAPKPIPRPEGRETEPPARLSRGQLYDLLSERCTVEEINVFAFELGVDPEDLDGDSRSERAMSLIRYLDRRNRLSELALVARKRRPDLQF